MASDGVKRFSYNSIARDNVSFGPFVLASDHEAALAEKDREIANLKSIISKEVSENDEFGSEFVLVNILKSELETARRVAYNRGVHDGIQGTYEHDGEDYIEKDGTR